MSYAQKRLYTSATRLAKPAPLGVSTAHLAKFPPTEVQPKESGSIPSLSPEVWAFLQPPPPTALAAFAHRTGLATVLPTTEAIQQACTHSSFLPHFKRHHPDGTQPLTNTQSAFFGNTLLGMFATEHLHAAYPHLPTQVLKAVVSAHVGPSTCVKVATEMGAAPLLRWHRSPATPLRPAVFHDEALASIPRALVALVYQNRSIGAARKFADSFFLSREVDIRSMIKFKDPKKALSITVAKFGRERPKSRLLKETGRFSNAPIFVVGIYSGIDKLGEGFGSSLKMAEFRAAEDSLHRLYLTRTPNNLMQIPTSTFAGGMGNVFRTDLPEGSYASPGLGESEVLYASSGRSSIVQQSRAEEAFSDEDVDIIGESDVELVEQEANVP